MQHRASASLPDAFEIRAQLELILNSQEFISCEKLREFLTYVIEESLAGRGKQIKAYNIGLEVFRLGKNFDPGINTVVRVTAGRVRNKLERYYLKAGAGAKVHIEIPRGSYLPAIRYAAENPAPPETPCAAPAYGDPAPQASTPSPARAPQHRPSILVLPFSNISGTEPLNLFLRGLAEEIAIALDRYDELVVSTPQATDDQLTDIWALAEKMGARFVINGSAQLSDNLLRLRITLADSLSRFQVWSDKFDSSFEAASFFSIQDEIAGQVVARITDSFNFIHRLQLKNELEKSSAGLEVYEAMLYYHYWLLSLAAQHFIKVEETLRTAMILEPASAALKGMLSDVYASHYQWGLSLRSNALDLSLQLAEEALRLDNRSQYGNWAKAYNCFLRRDKQNFLAYAHKALSLNPSNTNIMSAAGVKLIMTGQRDEGFDMLRAALRLNPHIPSWHKLGPFTVHYLAEDYGAALAEAENIITADFFWGPLARAATLGRLNRPEEGRAELDDVFKIMPDFKKTGYPTLLRLFFQEESAAKIYEGLKLSGL